MAEQYDSRGQNKPKYKTKVGPRPVTSRTRDPNAFKGNSPRIYGALIH